MKIIMTVFSARWDTFYVGCHYPMGEVGDSWADINVELNEQNN